MTSAYLVFVTRVLLLMVVILLLAGCSSVIVKQIPQTRLLAIRHNQKGVAETRKGNTKEALKDFNEALKLHGAIEDFDGMITSLINLARAHRIHRDVAAARAALDKALLLPAERPPLAAELFFENAKIYLAENNLQSAGEWARRSHEISREVGVNIGRSGNLIATVLLRRGLFNDARAEAEHALEANREQRLVEEEATSLRLLGEIDFAGGRYDTALAALTEALALDKTAGVRRNISTDLRLLGAVYLKKGEHDSAVKYFKRSLELNLSADDRDAAAFDRARLDEISKPAAAQSPPVSGSTVR
ncbi:MAG TPA: tetratricopeptide repeat protein [Desulfuromonadales bacterium]|nr:tetratricopeptide repeat protein [Desulfuromonadales bacterium]